MTSTLRFCIFALLLAGCASAPVDDPVQRTEITLLPGADAALSRTVRVRFDSIADSRCPPNVLCIWAGEVIYHLTLTSVKGKEDLRLRSGQGFDSAHVPGLRVALSAHAGPVVPMGTEAPPHSVVLYISPSKQGTP